MELSTVKEIFIELSQRFESTENFQAMETLINYFGDYDFGFDEEDVNFIVSYMLDVLNTIK